MRFDAILVTQDAPSSSQSNKVSLDESQLPEGEVMVEVHWSTLNYKDALAITGKAPVVRRFPMVPGIDLAGVVRDSTDVRFKPGDQVLLNGWGVGEQHWGGLATLARVKADWLIPMPAGLNAKDAMSIGTAGYTAMLCVMALQSHGVTPTHGPVLVTGANGGVGSTAIALLADLGYEVHASTGRVHEADHLRQLGATEIIDRSSLSQPGKPLQKERWVAVVDSVGSHTLANACASVKYGGIVAACGLAQGMDFPSTVAPFILRGITLAGVDSVQAPVERRTAAWARLAQTMSLEKLHANTEMVALADVLALAPRLLAGEVRGRVAVDVRA